MTDLVDRAKLEVEFAKSLDLIIDQLVSSNFSDADIAIFTDTVKTFLKYDDLKQFIVDALYDKVIEVSKIINKNDEIRFQSFSKLIQIILDLGNEELIDSLETYLARNKRPDHFFIFLEKKLRRGASLEKTEKFFIELMGVNGYSAEAVDKFLNIIQKDKAYLIKLLLNNDFESFEGNSKFHLLAKYIKELANKFPESIGIHVVPTLIEHYNGPLKRYMDLIVTVVERVPDFTNILLNNHKRNCERDFKVYVLASHTFNTNVIKNFCNYLSNYSPHELDSFENMFLNIADSNFIVEYALYVPTSKKRKVLRQLIKNKDEDQLVEFIENFPEYKALLPML